MWSNSLANSGLEHSWSFQYWEKTPPSCNSWWFSKVINKQFADTQRFFDIMLEANLDCIVSPGFPVPAVKHGHSSVLSYACLYTFLFNVLDMPTVALPVTLVKEGEEKYHLIIKLWRSSQTKRYCHKILQTHNQRLGWVSSRSADILSALRRWESCWNQQAIRKNDEIRLSSPLKSQPVQAWQSLIF